MGHSNPTKRTTAMARMISPLWLVNSWKLLVVATISAKLPDDLGLLQVFSPAATVWNYHRFPFKWTFAPLRIKLIHSLQVSLSPTSGGTTLKPRSLRNTLQPAFRWNTQIVIRPTPIEKPFLTYKPPSLPLGFRTLYSCRYPCRKQKRTQTQHPNQFAIWLKTKSNAACQFICDTVSVPLLILITSLCIWGQANGHMVAIMYKTWMSM